MGVYDLYLLCGFCFFPLLVLAAATSAVFGTAYGFLIAMTGALASASLAYFAARRLADRGPFRLAGPVSERLRRYLHKGGFIGVAFLRALPLFPFTITNFGLGIAGLRYGDYLLGTFLGLLPGVTAFTLLGDSFATLMTHPDAQTLAFAAAGLAAWLILILLLRQLARRLGYAEA